jgi:hypothetical protein
VQAAGFNPNRLDTLRSRTSAAYRGLYVLLQRDGACDFFWKARMIDLDLDDVKLDIHHIFPKKWCEGGHHLRGLRRDRQQDGHLVQGEPDDRRARALASTSRRSRRTRRSRLADAPMDAILRSHVINPALLRADEFEAFYAARKAVLLGLVEKAMGKAPTEATGVDSDDDGDDLEGEVDE